MCDVMNRMITWNPMWQQKLIYSIIDWVMKNPVHAWIALGVGIAVIAGIIAGIVILVRRIPDEPGDKYKDDSGSTGK